MQDHDTPASRGHGQDDSWANETLPMGVRRELLDREIQKYSPHRAGRGDPPGHGTETAGAGGDHPGAEGSDEHPG